MIGKVYSKKVVLVSSGILISIAIIPVIFNVILFLNSQIPRQFADGNVLGASESASAISWFRTRLGDVYSRDSVSLSYPSSSEAYLSTFLASYGSGTASYDEGELSLFDETLKSYDDNNSDVGWYQRLRSVASGKSFEKLLVDSPMDDWSTITDSSSPIVYWGTEDTPLDLEIPADSTCNRVVATFVSGNLVVNPDFTNAAASTGCMFIVNGDVQITNSGEEADLVEAAFVVNGTFKTK